MTDMTEYLPRSKIRGDQRFSAPDHDQRPIALDDRASDPVDRSLAALGEQAEWFGRAITRAPLT